MDWRSVTFDWNRARAFLVTAEEGSLSAAARALGMSQPTLGRQVEALQEEIGVILFERTGRGLVLTPSGLDLLDHVRAMGEAANRLSLTASGRSQELAGVITIGAGEAYAAHLLPPIVERLRRKHPGILVEIVATGQISDLKRREADIAIRNVEPQDPDLIARRLGDGEGRLYATPAYLASIGNPRTPAGFRDAAFISFADTGSMIDVLAAQGFSLRRENCRVACENHLVQWEFVKAGHGIGVMAALVGDAEPRVTRVLPELEPIRFPVWLVAHRELAMSRRVRVVFDLLAEMLA